MPLPKLQSALAKSIASLKAKDRTIDTLKAQLQATGHATTDHSASPRASSSELEAHKRLQDAEHRAQQAEARASKAEAECAQLVRASKDAGTAHDARVQDLSSELAALRREASERADADVRPACCVLW